MSFLKEGTEHMGSPDCKEWNLTHENCYGCPSEKVCDEYVSRVGQYALQCGIEAGYISLKEAEEMNKIFGETK